jgi:hypothetical protein
MPAADTFGPFLASATISTKIDEPSVGAYCIRPARPSNTIVWWAVNRTLGTLRVGRPLLRAPTGYSR